MTIRITLGLILITLSVALLLLFQKNNTNEKLKASKPEISNNPKIKEAFSLDTNASTSDTVWLSVSATKINPLSFTINGKLKNGDISFKSGQFVNRNDFIIALDMANFFTEVSKLKLSLREELLNVLGSNLKMQELDIFTKWNGFLEAIDLSKKLPAFPAIYDIEEEQIIRNSQVGNLYLKCQQLEQNTPKFFLLSKFEGFIWEVKKKIGDEVKANESVLSFVRKEDLVFSVINLFTKDLSKRNYILFDSKGQKLGTVNLIKNGNLKFKMDKITNKLLLLDSKAKYYIRFGDSI